MKVVAYPTNEGIDQMILMGSNCNNMDVRDECTITIVHIKRMCAQSTKCNLFILLPLMHGLAIEGHGIHNQPKALLAIRA